MVSLIYPSVPVPVLPRPTALSREAVPSGGEMVPVVEETGIVIGQASRSWCHRNALLHPVVHLHLINRSGEVFLQKRGPAKELYPGLWDTAVGGHVTFGESLEAALFRESEEELGFTQYNPVLLEAYVYSFRNEREWVIVYAAAGNFNLSPDNAEVSEGRWWKMQEIEDNLGKSVFTPNFEQEFRKVRPSLEALL